MRRSLRLVRSLRELHFFIEVGFSFQHLTLVTLFWGVMISALALAFAMGAENATFERDGEVLVGLTYMTGTLVKAQGALMVSFGFFKPSNPTARV